VVFLRHCGDPFAEKTFRLLTDLSNHHPEVHCVAVSQSSQEETDKWCVGPVTDMNQLNTYIWLLTMRQDHPSRRRVGCPGCCRPPTRAVSRLGPGPELDVVCCQPADAVACLEAWDRGGDMEPECRNRQSLADWRRVCRRC
jgi:hypothetical protein